MVVEDEPLILQNIIDKIHHVNPEFKVVYAAANGLDAWEHIEIYSPDLLITDIQMPVVNGLDLLARVKESYPAIECVILTGFNEFEYARKAIRSYSLDYLLKPINEDELLAAVRKAKTTLDFRASYPVLSEADIGAFQSALFNADEDAGWQF